MNALWRRVTGAFVCGAILGAALSWPAAAWRVEALLLQNDALTLQLEDARHQLSRLQESVNEFRAPVIHQVDIVTDVKQPDQRVALERAIRAIANEFVGRPVESLDRALLQTTFDGRLVSVDDQVYRLTLTFALIAPSSQLVFRVRRVAPGLPN